MWAGLELTAGKVPILHDGEAQIADCRMVGIYNGDQKSPNHAQGWVYLTSTRLCYVDDRHPEEHSCAVSLDQIKEAAYIPRFLRQSPKIELSVAAPAQRRPEAATWVCEICSFSNPLSRKYVPGKSDLPLCENCGVQCTEEPQTVPPPPLPQNQEGNTCCPRCTFVNHPYIRECEICGFVLKRHRKIVALGDQVKLSFRAGGAREFYTALEHALGPKETIEALPTHSQPPPQLSLGINQLQVKNELDLSNVRAIESNAKRIMALLEAHRRIAADYTPSYPLECQIVFREFMRDEESYLAQLARQVADFLESNDILRTQGGVMTLFDVYAAYNRARGTEPVAATDLNRALELAPQLGMPIQVRVLRTGTKIVESKLWSSCQDRLGAWVRRANPKTGVSLMEVCGQFGWSITVAVEELDQAEESGTICRDDTPAGARYFANLWHANTRTSRPL